MDPMTMSAMASMAGNMAQPALGAVEFVSGLIGSGKAKKALDANTKMRPNYEIPITELNNQRLAEARAGQGVGDRSLQAYQTGTQRGLTASLDKMLLGGGSMDNIGDLYTSYENGVSRMAQVDDAMHSQNVQNLAKQNDEYSGYLDKQWQMNKYAPWADKQKALSKDLADNQKLKWTGLNTAMAGIANKKTGDEYDTESNSVFGAKKSATAGSTPSDVWGMRAPTLAQQSAAGMDEIFRQRGGGDIPQQRTQQQQVSDMLQSTFPGLLPW